MQSIDDIFYEVENDIRNHVNNIIGGRVSSGIWRVLRRKLNALDQIFDETLEQISDSIEGIKNELS